MSGPSGSLPPTALRARFGEVPTVRGPAPWAAR